MKPKLTEAQLEQTVTDYLTVVEGWRVIKTDLKHLRGMGVQERGMPDRLYLRWTFGQFNLAIDHPARRLAEVMYIEFKRPGSKPKPHQTAWHAAERARGALILVVDDYHEFVRQYTAMGLARRAK